MAGLFCGGATRPSRFCQRAWLPLCRVRVKPSFAAARINSFALAGMGESELDVIGKRLAALISYRRLTAVVVPPADDLIIEQCLHLQNITPRHFSIQGRSLCPRQHKLRLHTDGSGTVVSCRVPTIL